MHIWSGEKDVRKRMQKINLEDKINFASLMIGEGKVKNLEAFYHYLPKRIVAEILGVNIVRFSNGKSNQPGDFKLAELLKLSHTLNVEHHIIIDIFKNSFENNITVTA